MPEFFIYLLKVNISLVLFCLAYYLILRRLTFYNVNRIFLLAGIAFSSVYPFIDFAALIGRGDSMIISVEKLPVVYNVIAQTKSLDYEQILKFVFWAGVVFMSIRMAIRFISLYRIHKNSTPENVINYPVRLLHGQISTFSFWQNIYLNPAQHQADELAAVLEHEQVHVKQWHTIDILAAEITTVFYWFNPGVWYMRKAVKENVEFITDQKILQKGVDRKAYQYSMISAVGSLQPSVLMNNFNLTAIKRRIIMMNSKRSGTIQLTRYFLIVPVLLAITCAFTLVKEAKTKTDPKPTGKVVVFNKKSAPVPVASSKIATKVAKPKTKKNTVKMPAPPQEIASATVTYTPDSNSIKGRVQGVRIEKSTPPDEQPTSGTLQGNPLPVDGVVTVKGYGTKQKSLPVPTDDQQPVKDVVVVAGQKTIGRRSVQGKELAPQNIFINDKEASTADYNKLKISDIEKVLNTENNGKKEVRIYTKPNS